MKLHQDYLERNPVVINPVPLCVPGNTIPTGKHIYTKERGALKNARRTAKRRAASGVVGNVPYQANSRSHVALSYMKMVHRWVTYTELCELSSIFRPTKGSRNSFQAEMNRLQEKGHVEVRRPTGKAVKGAVSEFRITQKGVIYLYTSAKIRAETHPLEDEEDFSDSAQAS